MANKKITELNAATSLAATDVVPVVDVSADETKKITATDLFRTLPDGTAAAPSLSFASDAANGIYLASSDTVGIATGGTQRVTVDGSGNVTISGDLTVSGATTTVESTTVTIDDKNIELGSVASPSNTTADGGGITLKGATDKTIKWINSTGYWTFNTGIDVGGHIELGDSSRIKLGADDDLEIYHNGGNVNESFIDNKVGNFSIRNLADDKDIALQTDNGSGGLTTYVLCDGSQGSVKLNHLGSEKLQTKSDGILVQGEVQSDSLDVNGAIDVTNSSAGSEVARFEGNYSSSGSVVLSNWRRAGGAVAGAFKYNDATTSMSFGTTTSHSLTIRTGDSDRLTIDSAGNVGIGTSNLNQNTVLSVHKADSSESQMRFTNSTTGEAGNNGFLVGIDSTEGGRLFVQENSYLRFGTNNTERLRITSSGNIGLATTSPQANLDIAPASSSATLRVHARSNTSAVSAIELVRGTNTTFGADVYQDWRLNNGGGELYLQYGQSGSTSEALRINSVGKVGISTTVPAGRLSVGPNEDIVFGNQASSGTSGTGRLVATGGIVYLQAAQAATSGSDAPLVVTGYGGVGERLRITSAGLVNVTGGVQVTENVTPTSGSGVEIFKASSTSGQIQAYNRGSSAWMNLILKGNTQQFHTAGTEAMRIDASNRLLLNTTTEGQPGAENLTLAGSGHSGMTIRSGTAEAGQIAFSDGTSGESEYRGQIYYHHGSDYMRFRTDSVERLRITSTGAWAIEGASNYGTSGQVLTSNGNDSPTWQDAGAGSAGGANAISMNDSVKINFGASNDLQIFHNGSNSFVETSSSSTGDLFVSAQGTNHDLYLQATDDILIRPQGGEDGIKVIGNGAVELYHDNSKKLETKSDGVDIVGELQCDSLDVDGSADFTGTVNFHNGVGLQDNDKLFFGTSGDLEIYHDGNNSFIKDTGTGRLTISTSQLQLTNAADSEVMIRADQDGEVNLYHNGVGKLATKSTGIDVTGEVECDNLTVSGITNLGNNLDMPDNAKVILGSGDDLKVYHNGTNSLIENSTGDLTLTNSSDDIILQSADDIFLNPQGGENGVNILGNGAVELFHNNSLRFQTNATATTMRGGGEHRCEGHFRPWSNNAYDLGTNGDRWRNVYTNDLHLSNEGSANDVDGTWGNYTIQEGEDDLFLINRRNGKKYKFNLTEVS